MTTKEYIQKQQIDELNFRLNQQTEISREATESLRLALKDLLEYKKTVEVLRGELERGKAEKRELAKLVADYKKGKKWV